MSRSTRWAPLAPVALLLHDVCWYLSCSCRGSCLWVVHTPLWGWWVQPELHQQFLLSEAPFLSLDCVVQHYNLMYAYSAMASYFARDNVALLGFAKVIAISTTFSVCT
jgi:hypothetical protein